MISYLKPTRLGLFLFAIFLGPAPASLAHIPVFDFPTAPLKGSDSGISGPSFLSLREDLKRLTQQYSSHASMIDYGKTQDGRPLIGIQIQSKTAKTASVKSPRAILITGGIHGDEYLGIEDRLAHWLIEKADTDEDLKNFLADGNRIYFFPILNPDGYTRRFRVNANGVDLNRDFNLLSKNYFAFEENETRGLAQWLNEELKKNPADLALTLDYHCCVGALLHPKESRAPASSPRFASRTERVGEIFKNIFGAAYRFGTTPQVLGYDSLGTSKDYFAETYGALGFTFEGQKQTEKDNFSEHQRFWKKIFSSVVRGEL